MKLKPVIVQDASTREILMVAYANDEAVQATKDTGFATFWSRSRNKLWKKGETSGNLQKIVEVREDCDKDTLLYLVEPQGPACHTGNYSCFREDRPFMLEDLEKVIKQRKQDLPEGSYTAKLLRNEQLLKKKIIEEAGELAISKNRDNTVAEAADLFYHTLVLLSKKGTCLSDVLNELRKRRPK